MQIKPNAGIKFRGVAPELVLALQIADGVWQDLGQELIITSLVNGKHSHGSLHYIGHAADLRSRYFADKGVTAAAMLKARLSDEFDVVVEKTHIHLEFQPKEV